MMSKRFWAIPCQRLVMLDCLVFSSCFDVKWHRIMVLICSSLIIKEIEYFFVVHIFSFFVKWLLMSFAHFLSGVIVLLMCRSSWYILDSNHLLIVHVVDILSFLFFNCCIFGWTEYFNILCIIYLCVPDFIRCCCLWCILLYSCL